MTDIEVATLELHRIKDRTVGKKYYPDLQIGILPGFTVMLLEEGPCD